MTCGKHQLIQATNFYPGRKRNGRPVGARMVVLHSIEAPQGVNTAENVAKWMAGPNAPLASVHLLADIDSICQGVRLGDTAFGAKGANADAVHVEHAGYARRSRAEWLRDDWMLNISAAAVAEVCNALWIPPARLTVAQVADGRSRGITTHADVTKAFRIRGGHTDPGNGFPMDLYIDKVRWFLPNAKTLHAHR